MTRRNHRLTRARINECFLRDQASAASVRPTAALHVLNRLPYQLVLGLLVTVVVPAALYHVRHLALAYRQPSSLNTEIGASLALVIALYLYRRVSSYPGFGLLGFVMPAVAAGYAIVLA